jgi:hypothetical protein
MEQASMIAFGVLCMLFGAALGMAYESDAHARRELEREAAADESYAEERETNQRLFDAMVAAEQHQQGRLRAQAQLARHRSLRERARLVRCAP